MSIYDFNQEFERFFKELTDRTTAKQIEYARNNDPFHNFNVAAIINDSTPERELHGFMTKHLVSYLDMIKDLEYGAFPSKEQVDEKIGDLIVYLAIQRIQLQKSKAPVQLPF